MDKRCLVINGKVADIELGNIEHILLNLDDDDFKRNVFVSEFIVKDIMKCEVFCYG